MNRLISGDSKHPWLGSAFNNRVPKITPKTLQTVNSHSRNQALTQVLQPKRSKLKVDDVPQVKPPTPDPNPVERITYIHIYRDTVPQWRQIQNLPRSP